jgi:hypothetical protein
MKTINKTYTVLLRHKIPTTTARTVREKQAILGGEALTVRRAGVLMIFFPEESRVPVYRIRLTEEMAQDRLNLAALLEV